MIILTIQTRAQFEAWLSEHHWFADTRVLMLTPVPNAEKELLPETVTMELAYPIEGNYRAHSTRISRHLRFVAREIHEYHLLGEANISSKHWSEGMQLIEGDHAIAFSIDLPAPLILQCGMATVEGLPNLVETVQPWLSDRDVFAYVPGVRLPTPEDWIALFARQGVQVAWHIYRDQPKATAQVPQSDYRGWFLQDPIDLDDFHQGIFFFSCCPHERGFNVVIENHGASTRLWYMAKVILGQFKNVEIHCGNCVLPGPEYLAELKKREEIGKILGV